METLNIQIVIFLSRKNSQPQTFSFQRQTSTSASIEKKKKGVSRNALNTKSLAASQPRKTIKSKENSRVVSVNTNVGLVKYQVTTTKLCAGLLP